MYEVQTYKNGLRLVYDFDDSTKAVSVVFGCAVGGADEDGTNRGIAHLAEHMFFKGTNKRTAKEITLIFDKLGIANNASTGNDVTMYYATGMNEHLETIFDVYSDCFFNSTYESEGLELEKKAVCSELEMYLDDYKDLVRMKGAEVALQGTPYQYTLGGTVESVTKLKQADLVAFRDKFYTTNRLIISVSGNVSKEKVEALIEKYILCHCDEELTPVTYNVAPLTINLQKRFNFEKRDIDQCYCLICFKSIHYNDPKMLKYRAMNVVWGDIMSSRLFRKVREEKGLVYVVSAYDEVFKDAGVNGIIFYANKNNTEEVLKTIRQTILETKQDGFTDEELETAKNVLKTSYTLGGIMPSARAKRGFNSVLYKEKPFNIEEKFNEIDALTTQDLNDAFNEFVDFDDLSVAVVGKEFDEKVLDILLGK